LGLHAVPVIVLPGQRVLTHFSERDLAAAVGVADRATAPDLPTAVNNLDILLGAVLRAARQLGDADLDIKTPQRGRDMRELIHDVFFKVFRWAPERGPATRAAGQREAAAGCTTVESLTRYAEPARAAVRRRFSSGLKTGDVVGTADGPMPAAAAVAWLGDHTAHHLRQIYRLMECRGITPRDPLDPASLTGVSLQKQLW
jgi:hypothetical protein